MNSRLPPEPPTGALDELGRWQSEWREWIAADRALREAETRRADDTRRMDELRLAEARERARVARTEAFYRGFSDLFEQLVQAAALLVVAAIFLASIYLRETVPAGGKANRESCEGRVTGASAGAQAHAHCIPCCSCLPPCNEPASQGKAGAR